MAKQRPKRDLSAINFNETVSEATGKPAGKSFTIEDTKQPAEREPGLTIRGRVKFTTMLKPELREKLQAIADNRAISIADVLETMIEEYLGLK